MKNITTVLQNFLVSATEFATCDLLTITLQNGTIIYATNADVDITWNSVLWSSSVIKFGRSKTSSATGGAVADLQLQIYADSTIQIGGVQLLQAVRGRIMDGATVKIDTLFLSDWQTPVGIVNNFFGLISGIEAGRTHAAITVKAPTHLLDTQMPRNLYQAGCMRTLFDAGCTLNRAAYATAGVIQTGSAGVTINWNAPIQPTNYYTRGYVLFTSGTNNGLRYTVSASASSGALVLSRPMTSLPAAGDTFTVYAGCDRQQATCATKFNNLANFKAFPYVPVPSTAI